MRLVVLCSARLSTFQVQVLDALHGALAGDPVEVVGAVIDCPGKGRRGQRGWGGFARLKYHLRKGRGGYVLVMAAESLARLGPCGGREIPAERFFARLPWAAGQLGSGRPVDPASGPPGKPGQPAVLATDDLYSPATLGFIRQCRPDCIFRSGFGIIREPVLSMAPRGVISYHHGDLRKFRGLPPAFWELYTGQREMRVTVQQLAGQLDGGRIVHEIVVPIHPADSWRSLHARAYQVSVPMAADACRLLADPNFQPTALSPDQLGPLYTLPNLRQWLTLQWRVLRRKMASR